MDEARSCEASYGNPYAGTQPETADTDKGKPTAKPLVISHWEFKRLRTCLSAAFQWLGRVAR